MRRSLLASFVLIALAIPSPAAIVITSSGVPTIGVPGYSTYTLTAMSTAGEQIVGFDFASLPTYGFFGAMRQLNPAGLPTIFQDNNRFFPFVLDYDASQGDSQFKFISSNLIVPSGFASESAGSLRAVFASANPLGTSVPFVQIATSGSVFYHGTVTTLFNGSYADVLVTGIVPEPTSTIFAFLTLCAGVLTRRR